MVDSIWDLHLKLVKKLKDRGEKVLTYPGVEPMDKGNGPFKAPSVYNKLHPFPHKHFQAGTGIEEKDGTISIIYDHMIGEWCGFDIKDVGLCDASLIYANDRVLEELEANKKVVNKCPACGHVIHPV
jgi:hypothetical protein